LPASLSPWSELAILWRLFVDVGPYLRNPLTPDECHRRVRVGLSRRSASFLEMLEHGVFAVPTSPYRRLLEHADVGLPDLRRSVEAKGVEGTLAELHAAGVYLTLGEFKGRTPVVRGGLTIETRSRDFDNPLSGRHFMTETGGSRSSGTRVYVDLAHYERDAIYDYLFAEAFSLLDRPWGSWRTTPPHGAGIKSHLSRAKLGRRSVHWFSQTRLRLRSRAWKHAVLMETVFLGSLVARRPLTRPRYVPLAEAWRVAAWLEECREAGTPALLNTNAASSVRVAMAALERGMDISGTVFRVGGEPFTDAKASVLRAAGTRWASHYTMGETGRIAVACPRGGAVDDAHILEDKMAVIQEPRRGGSGAPAPVNVYTTLHGATPKLMLNVESDDYGPLVRRSCGCLLDEVGYDLHIQDIRSWEKLTSEGMNFLGADLLRLVEEVLPARFGGNPTDYQFLEEEENGLPKVALLVSPRVGGVDEESLMGTVLSFLDTTPGSQDDNGDRWREGETLRVRRQEPIATGASKVLALHTTRKAVERQ
jgi:hypothetical protein